MEPDRNTKIERRRKKDENFIWSAEHFSLEIISGGLAGMLGCERNPGPYNLVESGPLLEKNRDLQLTISVSKKMTLNLI